MHIIFKKMTPEFLNPEEVLNQLELRPDMVAADFGCGSGSFAIRLAKKLEHGLVYAIDIQEVPLSVLKSRFLSEKVINIKVIRSDLEKQKGSTLVDSSVDLVLMINILFQTEDENAVFAEAARVLKKGGKLLVVDWSPEAIQGPAKGKVSIEKIKEIAEKLKLKTEKEFKTGEYHYGIIFTKP